MLFIIRVTIEGFGCYPGLGLLSGNGFVVRDWGCCPGSGFLSGMGVAVRDRVCCPGLGLIYGIGKGVAFWDRVSCLGSSCCLGGALLFKIGSLIEGKLKSKKYRIHDVIMLVFIHGVKMC